MIQKTVLTVLLSYTLLFSAEVTGAWQMDMPKMQKTMPMEKYIVQASPKRPENRLTLLDDRHMKIVFNDAKVGKLIFYFKKK